MILFGFGFCLGFLFVCFDFCIVLFGFGGLFLFFLSGLFIFVLTTSENMSLCLQSNEAATNNILCCQILGFRLISLGPKFKVLDF